MRLRSSSACFSCCHTRSWLRRSDGCHDLDYVLVLCDTVAELMDGDNKGKDNEARVLTSSNSDRHHPFWTLGVKLRFEGKDEKLDEDAR